jgi:hypothetical protein
MDLTGFTRNSSFAVGETSGPDCDRGIAIRVDVRVVRRGILEESRARRAVCRRCGSSNRLYGSSVNKSKSLWVSAAYTYSIQTSDAFLLGQTSNLQCDLDECSRYASYENNTAQCVVEKGLEMSLLGTCAQSFSNCSSNVKPSFQ